MHSQKLSVSPSQRVDSLSVNPPTLFVLERIMELARDSPKKACILSTQKNGVNH